MLFFSQSVNQSVKIALMTFSCIDGTRPASFHGICHPIVSVEERYAVLTKAKYGQLNKPRTKGKRYGPHNFRVAAPTA